VQPNLLKYLDRRLPRYTSYPTAVQFSSGVGAATYQCWLAALEAAEPVSIYIHIPFCAELCLYCGCHSTVARGYAPVAAYVDLLEREIALVGGIAGRCRVSQVHWGGGTPNVLTPQDFMRVMAAIETHFTMTPQTELAVEIDPRTLTQAHVAAFSKAGITRASVGVQDFEPRVQEAIRRVQSFDQTARAVDRLRAAGARSINLDLMYGLPCQTVETIEQTARHVLALEPQRIAIFGYAHVPWMKRHQRLLPERELPAAMDRMAQARAAADVLISAGYQPIGLDHFATTDDELVRHQRAGKLRRNFQGYTTDQSRNLLGFGTSAIGILHDGYVQNAAATPAYRDAIRNGRLATVRGCALTDEDRLRGDIIERLMCDLYVDLEERCASHDRNASDFAAELSRIDDLVRSGLVKRTGSKLSVPETKRHFIRAVCAVFDAYLTSDTSRYSQAS